MVRMTMVTYYRGVSWYRLHYTVPTTYDGQRLLSAIRRSQPCSDVYVNGTYLGEHQGGFALFASMPPLRLMLVAQ